MRAGAKRDVAPAMAVRAKGCTGSWGRLCLSKLSFLIRIYKLLLCLRACVCMRLKVCHHHRHNLKPTKAFHLHLLLQHRAALIVISKAATAFPLLLWLQLNLLLAGGWVYGQTCAGSFPLLLFLPTYAAFFLHRVPAVSRIPTPQPPPPSSSSSSSSSTATILCVYCIYSRHQWNDT